MVINKEDIHCDICGALMHEVEVEVVSFTNDGYINPITGSYYTGITSPSSQIMRGGKQKLHCNNDDCNFMKDAPHNMKKIKMEEFEEV